MNRDGIPNAIHRPAHYTQGDIECIDAMVAAFGEEAVKTFAKLNAFKYQWRAEHKGCDEDLKKAIWYLRYAIGDDPRKEFDLKVGEQLAAFKKFIETERLFTNGFVDSRGVQITHSRRMTEEELKTMVEELAGYLK